MLYITADYSTGAAQDERLVTPTVDLTGATKMELDFAYALSLLWHEER
ncbi:MAG: hypothetical protein ACLSHU_07580 [Oscillospiraceae bacterium]